METKDIQIEIEEGKKDKKQIEISQHQQCKKERRQHAKGIRMLLTRKEHGGDVAAKRNNRITEFATKEAGKRE